MVAGELFLGAMSATQKDMFSETDVCYEYAEIVQIELVDEMFAKGDLFANMINRGQILQVKIQTAFDSCGINVLISSLDSRMSNLDYTLGMISNVISQFAGGFQTQEWSG